MLCWTLALFCDSVISCRGGASADDNDNWGRWVLGGRSLDCLIDCERGQQAAMLDALTPSEAAYRIISIHTAVASSSRHGGWLGAAARCAGR